MSARRPAYLELDQLTNAARDAQRARAETLVAARHLASITEDCHG